MDMEARPVYLKVPQGQTRYTKRQLAQLPLRYWLVPSGSNNKQADWDLAEFILLEPPPEVEQQVTNQVAESQAKEINTTQKRRQRRKKHAAAAKATTTEPLQDEYKPLAKQADDLLPKLKKCEEEKEVLRAQLAAANQLVAQAAALDQDPSNLQSPASPLDDRTIIARLVVSNDQTEKNLCANLLLARTQQKDAEMQLKDRERELSKLKEEIGMLHCRLLLEQLRDLFVKLHEQMKCEDCDWPSEEDFGAKDKVHYLSFVYHYDNCCFNVEEIFSFKDVSSAELSNGLRDLWQMTCAYIHLYIPSTFYIPTRFLPSTSIKVLQRFAEAQNFKATLVE